MQPGFWLWPVPPPGTLRVSCEWPLLGIALATVELDGSALARAAAAATKLWGS
jgi:hypothetical protein